MFPSVVTLWVFLDGMRGGGLAQLDPLTDTVSALFRDADQSVQAVTADRHHLYFGTSVLGGRRYEPTRILPAASQHLRVHSGGRGSDTTTVEAQFVIWDTESAVGALIT